VAYQRTARLEQATKAYQEALRFRADAKNA